MKIELRNVSINELKSEETTCFVADLYVGGVKVGEAKNDGNGESSFVQVVSGKQELLEKAEAYAKSLPDIQYPDMDFSVKSCLESIIDDLLLSEQKKKDEKELIEKMETSIIWGKKGELKYNQVSFPVPLSTIPKAQLQGYVYKYKAEFKKGEEFWNTNLEALGITL